MFKYYKPIKEMIETVPLFANTAVLAKAALKTLNEKEILTELECVSITSVIQDRLAECQNRLETSIKLTIKDRTSGDKETFYCSGMEIAMGECGIKVAYEDAITEQPEQLEIDTNEYEYFIEGA